MISPARFRSAFASPRRKAQDGREGKDGCDYRKTSLRRAARPGGAGNGIRRTGTRCADRNARNSGKV